jgi:hypothetical protein
MSTLELLMTGTLPVIFSVLFYWLTNVNSKINDLDIRLRDAVSHKDVRLLIDDKITPIREDIHEIKLKLDKIFDIYYPLDRK